MGSYDAGYEKRRRRRRGSSDKGQSKGRDEIDELGTSSWGGNDVVDLIWPPSLITIKEPASVPLPNQPRSNLHQLHHHREITVPKPITQFSTALSNPTCKSQTTEPVADITKLLSSPAVVPSSSLLSRQQLLAASIE
ncbi:hypothetical protein M0R45_000398 [Rubus argutus]|uniref:Uncharacterized protein n=1 Tax=Rubus argutus TaxID=59490 RepID=A0AAW1VQA8_RUBAR